MKTQTKKFRALFSTYLVSIVLPITVLGFITVCIFFNRLAADTRQLNYKIMNYTQLTVDSVFSSLVSLSLQVRENVTIQDLMIQADETKELPTISLWEIQRELNGMFSSDVVDTIGVYIPAIDMFIDKHKKDSFEDFYKLYIENSVKSMEDARKILSEAKSKNFLLDAGTYDNLPKMLYLRPLDLSKKNMGVVFFAVINSDILLDKIEYMSGSSDKSYAMLSSDGNIALQTNDFKLPEGSDLPGNSGELKDGRNTILYAKSLSYPLKHIFIFHNSSLSGNVYIFALWFIALLICAALLSVFLAKFNIGKIFSKVVKENLRLSQDVNRSVKEIRKQKLLNYIYNVKTNKEFEEITNEYDFGFHSDHLIVACISPIPSDEILSSIKYEPNTSVTNKLAEILAMRQIEFDYINTDAATAFILGISNYTVLQTAEIIESCLAPMDKPVTFIGMGDLVTGTENLWKSYDGATQAVRYAMLNKNKNVVFYSDIRVFESNKISFTNQKEISLIQNINTGSENKVTELMDELYKVHFVEKQLSSSAITRLIVTLALSVYRVAENLFTDDEELDKYDRIVNNTLKNNNPEEAYMMLRETCLALCRENAKKDNNVNFKNEAITYIQNNYMRYDLSLEMLAEHLNMNYYYLSRLFKKTIGSNFASYLTVVRMEKAKEYLENTDMTVKEISSKVGFIESNSFIRAFKKYYHVTPGQHIKGNNTTDKQ